MEDMKYFVFYRELNSFTDILTDKTIKKHAMHKIQWDKHLMIGIDNYVKNIDTVYSYITLKFGDDIRTNITKDYRPIPNVDYTPIRK